MAELIVRNMPHVFDWENERSMIFGQIIPESNMPRSTRLLLKLFPCHFKLETGVSVKIPIPSSGYTCIEIVGIKDIASGSLSISNYSMVGGRVAHPILKGPSVVKELIIRSMIRLAARGLGKIQE
ncbi:cytochrome c oxidase subunit 5C-2 [Tanacetum coccineum]